MSDVVNMYVHQPGCKRAGLGHSDAAKRVYDTYLLHRMGNGNAAVGHWFAFSLSDGTTDGALYASKQEAIDHQKHNETYRGFIQIVPPMITICEAEAFIYTSRIMYAVGASGGVRELIPRVSGEDNRSMLKSISNGGRTRPRNLTRGE